MSSTQTDELLSKYDNVVKQLNRNVYCSEIVESFNRLSSYFIDLDTKITKNREAKENWERVLKDLNTVSLN